MSLSTIENPMTSLTHESALRSRLRNFSDEAPSLMDGRHQVLLITSKEEIRSDLHCCFERDLKIAVAETVEHGMSILHHDGPAAIICDVNTNISELTAALSKGGRCEIPVLVLGSIKDRKKIAALIGHGVSDFLTFPIEEAEVRNRVENYMQVYLAKQILKSQLGSKEASLEKLAQETAFRAQELDRKNKMKDEFLAMLSHELRNPINVISGFAEVLLHNAEDAELAQEAAETIYRNAQYQTKLIQDLLDVSRSMNGKMVLECKPLLLDSMLHDILPSAENAAEKKDIKIHIRSKTVGLINADYTRITQVIWNLLSNAIKFTPESGDIDIEIGNQGPWVEMRVKDSGVGIDPEFLPHVFEQFNQQDSGITQRFGGLGLGLTIVKNIVELHNGSIEAQSDGIGHGATFVLRLPSLPN